MIRKKPDAPARLFRMTINIALTKGALRDAPKSGFKALTPLEFVRRAKL